MPVENSSAIDELKQLLKRGDIDLDEYTRRVLALEKPTQIENTDSGAVATAHGVAAGEGGVAAHKIGGDVTIQNITQVIQQPTDVALSLPEALRHYLNYLIEAHQRLRLQGIRAGSQPLSIDLEKVYISLTAIEKSVRREAMDAMKGMSPHERDYSGILTIATALQRYKRLVIIGDPGSGKTTLLSYLALTYARMLRDGANSVQERLQLDEREHLPILLPLRDFGRHLKENHSDSSKDGAALLLNYLRAYYEGQDIALPKDFFSTYLEEGQAIVLLDGMDEVAEVKLRQRVARLIEKFVVRYKHVGNRFIVTSREVGYEGAARLGEEFGLAKVRDFNRDEVRRFVRDWTHAVEATLAGHDTLELQRLANAQAEKLIAAIENNPRVNDLAVNPLLLTVIALVHRYRASLPDRRSELYEEAVEVLLGKWDEAKGMETEMVLAGRALDAGDSRSLLAPVAFWLHEKKRREIELDDLRKLLLPPFTALANNDKTAAAKAVDQFINLINERSGLLIKRGTGVYGFAHLTFQEYLTARVIVDREDLIDYTLKRLPDAWWREVILLEAGFLSVGGPTRVSKLIRAIMEADPKTEPESCHHLVLAAECLFDVGQARVEGDLLSEVKAKLQKEADTPFKKGNRDLILRKVVAVSALGRIDSGTLSGAGKYWKLPYGEPEWVTVPAGEFWMGSEKSRDRDNEKPLHRVYVAKFQIAKVPITNAQYALYVAETKAEAPEHWEKGQPPTNKENHPVVNVSWNDARNYCAWLIEKINRDVRLPTEAEWEKAARGDKDKREYPWGDEWAELRCNSEELGLSGTSPVGIFNNASLCGCLDMAGDVWERCLSKLQPYPYRSDDGREKINQSSESRVVRGGSFDVFRWGARCACRLGDNPISRSSDCGFRVVVSLGSRT